MSGDASPGAARPAYKSKSIATWAAILGGLLGLHRLYLRGWTDAWAWLHLLPTALGVWGIVRLRNLGVDDRLAWALLPIFSLMLTYAMGCAIRYALTPDEQWDLRHNPAWPPQGTRWAPVLGAVLALLVGAGALMFTVAFSGQRLFEIERESSLSSGTGR